MCYNPISVVGVGLVPCGHCLECVSRYSTEWTARCVLEASLYKKNCMITLTYDEASLPASGKLERSDYQKFLKRLRKKFSDIKIRYYGCGEYGSLKGRPHFHIILFNFDFDDKYFYKTDKKGVRLYRSDTLEKLWTFGFSTIGEVNSHTVKYCTKYLQKCFFDKSMRGFSFMSKMNGGIGLQAFQNSRVPVISDKIYYDGRFTSIPEYFLRKVKETDEISFDYVKSKRRNKAMNDFIFKKDYFIDDDGVVEPCFEIDEVLYFTEMQNRKKKVEEKFGKFLTY